MVERVAAAVVAVVVVAVAVVAVAASASLRAAWASYDGRTGETADASSDRARTRTSHPRLLRPYPEASATTSEPPWSR